MGVGYEVFRLLRYSSRDDCAHLVLLRAGQPSYPNADQGAEDAAGAFSESALEHLRVWFETWRLPPLCPAAHECEHIGDGDDASLACDDDEFDLLTGPGFVWVDVAWTVGERGHLTLGSDQRDVSRARAYLLADRGAEGDLHEG